MSKRTTGAKPKRKSENQTSEPKPRRSLFARIILICLALLLLIAGAAASSAWWVYAWSGKPYGSNMTVAFSIRSGTSLLDYSKKLEEEGVLSDARLFDAYVLALRKQSHLQAGDYRIELPIAPEKLLHQLEHGSFELKLTIPEGWTSAQVADALVAKNLIAKPEDWLNLIAKPVKAEILGAEIPQGSEGFCFPDTYFLEKGMTPEAILERLLKHFAQIWKGLKPDERDPQSANLSILQVVTLASIIEREARKEDEMPTMASVFLNRMKINMKLQSCATVRYALGNVWDRDLTFADLKVDSPYNTYKNAGLPPAPIGNPSRAALNAVLHPAQTPYKFFVYRGDGTHEFTETYEAHKKATQKFHKADPHADFVKPAE